LERAELVVFTESRSVVVWGLAWKDEGIFCREGMMFYILIDLDFAGRG